MVYQLAKNPEVLETLVREVDDVLDTFEGRVDHETIADMAYLEACVKETLRSETISSAVRLRLFFHLLPFSLINIFFCKHCPSSASTSICQT
jgi:hypothetical protein